MDRFVELAAFVRTVQRGSQAAAARELGVTPAMVGRYICALEDRLGARLLNRTTATQSLTEAGHAFHARAGTILEQMEAAETAVSDRQAVPSGVLRVNAPMAFGVRHLAAAVAGFGARHPALRVELSLNDRVVDLVDEGFDVGIRIARLTDSSLVARRIAPCRLVVCAAPAYLAAHPAPERPEDLRAHDCLSYAYGSDTWRFQQGAEKAEVTVQGRLSANNGEALHEAALAGAGIALQPTFIAGAAIRDGHLVRLLPKWEIPELAIHAVYPSARHLSPKVRAFVDHMARHYAGTPPWDTTPHT